MKTRRKTKPIIGWREWIELPDLCATPIKTKIDTGARTSALHAFDLEMTTVGGARMASFVIVTTARAAQVDWSIEVTLASRDEMGFRMLLGRSALRKRFLVDPGRSFLATKPPLKSPLKMKRGER